MSETTEEERLIQVEVLRLVSDEGTVLVFAGLISTTTEPVEITFGADRRAGNELAAALTFDDEHVLAAISPWQILSGG